MKHLFVLFFSTLLIGLAAQNKEIVFETGNFASILEKAKKENKYVFIDAYTEWCGPCKMMARETFKTDTIANYFNKNFINYKMDMEKGEGIDFSKKYEVNCYPNLLLLDGSGKPVHRGAGYLKAKEFLVFGQDGLSDDKNFYSQKTNLQKNSFTDITLNKYISLMNSACLDASEAVSVYLKALNPQVLIYKNNWILMRDNSKDIHSPELVYLIQNFKLFAAKYNSEVEEKIVSLGINNFEKFINDDAYDQKGYEKSKLEFTALKWPYTDHIIYDTELKLNRKFNKPGYYAMATQSDFLKYNGKDPGTLNSMAWTFYEEVTDAMQLKAAVAMAKRAVELKPSHEIIDTYAAVLFKSGNTKEAIKQAEKAIAAAKATGAKPDDYKETSELLRKMEDSSTK